MTLILEKLNWKTIIISALAAVFISILSGLAGGVGIPSILLRAVIVLLLVAVFASLVNILAMTFLDSGTVRENKAAPDLSRGEGSNINIVLTEDDDAISELQSGNSEGEQSSNSSVQDEDYSRKSQKTVDSSGNSVFSETLDIDSLPDLGSFSTTFSSAVDNEEKKTDSEVESGYNESNSLSSGSRFSAKGLAGTIAEQNKPEDLAKAVKTVLKREEAN